MCSVVAPNNARVRSILTWPVTVHSAGERGVTVSTWTDRERRYEGFESKEDDEELEDAAAANPPAARAAGSFSFAGEIGVGGGGAGETAAGEEEEAKEEGEGGVVKYDELDERLGGSHNGGQLSTAGCGTCHKMCGGGGPGGGGGADEEEEEEEEDVEFISPMHKFR